VVQAGQKTQFGGLKDGLFNAKYQVSIELNVKYDEINQIRSGNQIERIILIYLFIIKMLYNKIIL